MPDWFRKSVGGVTAQIPTVLTLAALGGLAFWGAANDWRLPSLGEKKEASEEEKANIVKVVKDPAATGSEAIQLARIAFPSEEAVEATGIRVVPAAVRTMTQSVTANGSLDYEPGRYAQLASRAPGTIWKMYKKMGEAVEKNEVLAIIESAEVGKAKAAFLQSLAQFDVRTRTLQRLQSAGASVAEGTLREAEEAVREARLRRFADYQQLLNLGLVLHPEALASLSLEQQMEALAGLPLERQFDELRLLGFPEKFRQTELNKAGEAPPRTANLLPVIAPFDSQVVRHPRGAPGEVVATNQPLFFIGDTSHLHIDLEVYLEDAALLARGQKVIFTPEDKKGAPAVGELAHISPEVNEKTRHVQVHAEVENPDGRLRPNTFGTGRIVIREQQSVAVPVEAVQWEIHAKGRSYFVFVELPNKTTFQVRPVQIGLQDGGYTGVTGIEPGARVVTTGSHVLKSELLKNKIGGGED
jgi:cobalt-zinc-cadmium efflux system membrane fusion protein